MAGFETKIRSLASAALLAAAIGLGAMVSAPAAAAPGAAPLPPTTSDIVPVRQDHPWFAPGGQGRDRWDDNDGWDDDHRDRRRHRARERCLDRDPIARWGYWEWDHGSCRWHNERPER